MKHYSPLSDFLPELLPCRQTIIRSYTVFVTAFAMFLLSITLKPIVFYQLFPQGYFLIMLKHRKVLAEETYRTFEGVCTSYNWIASEFIQAIDETCLASRRSDRIFPHTTRHKQYTRVKSVAADGSEKIYLVRKVEDYINGYREKVCVIISKPKVFLVYRYESIDKSDNEMVCGGVSCIDFPAVATVRVAEEQCSV